MRLHFIGILILCLLLPSALGGRAQRRRRRRQRNAHDRAKARHEAALINFKCDGIEYKYPRLMDHRNVTAVPMPNEDTASIQFWNDKCVTLPPTASEIIATVMSVALIGSIGVAIFTCVIL
jgi:hypothetical protein